MTYFIQRMRIRKLLKLYFEIIWNTVIQLMLAVIL